MAYTVETMRKVLDGLDDDPDNIIYTEHYVEQMERRKISEDGVEEFLRMGNAAEITKVEGFMNRFHLRGFLDEYTEVSLLVSIFNLKGVILLSAVCRNVRGDDDAFDVFEFEGIYDGANEMLHMYSRYGFMHCLTVEVEQGFNIDFDACGHPMAVELTRASKLFKINWKVIPEAKFTGSVEITESMIRIRIKAALNRADIKDRVIEREVANDYGILPGSFEFVVCELIHP
jgi:hypothetical protein